MQYQFRENSVPASLLPDQIKFPLPFREQNGSRWSKGHLGMYVCVFEKVAFAFDSLLYTSKLPKWIWS